MTIIITKDFECGNINVLSADDPNDIRVEIEMDGKADFFQWFYFKVKMPAGLRTISFMNAAKASYPGGWDDYLACYTVDGETWLRAPTRYVDGVLTIEHTIPGEECTYAYFPPYTATEAEAFAAKMGAHPGVERRELGQSLEGRPIDLLRFGDEGEDKRKIWVIGRQHPGESMGSFFVEGVCEGLLQSDNAMATALLEAATVYVVPMMNPDGVYRGHLRTNAAGMDLNRSWAEPSAEMSPEVKVVRDMMDKTGCDLFLDAHGDEAIANNFIAGSEGIPGWQPRLATLLSTFKNQLIQATPDFQDKEGYPIAPAGKANLRIANNAIGERFQCLSMTLEMPFKDAKTNPKPDEGWSPRRCKELAGHTITVMNRIAPRLR